VAAAVAAQGRFPVSRVAETIGVSRSQLHARTAGSSKPRGRYRKAGDDELLPALRRLVDERPTYGYRRITALLSRERRAEGLGPVNRKRMLRIPGLHGLTLDRSTGRREGRVHDGKVAVMASNPRWCPDACELTCRNGEKVRIALAIVLGPMADEARSSTPSTARSSPASPSRAPGSAARTSAT
jgi:transposase InsO family protein